MKFDKKKITNFVQEHKSVCVAGLIAFCIVLFLSLQASNYYYVTYVQNLHQSANTSAFGASAQVYKPNFISCMVGAFTIDGFPFHGIYMGVFLPSFLMYTVLIGGGYFFWHLESEQKKQRKQGHEHGKGRIATKKDIANYQAKFMSADKSYNMLFSKNIGLSLDNKLCGRSANVLVIGGTGTGKTFRYIKPNLAQENCSMIITDPSGDLFRSFAGWLIARGHNVYLFNVSDLTYSNQFNPLLNVYTPEGTIDPQKVDVLVDLYMKNAKAGKEAGGGDPFWDKAEKAFMTAVIYYVLENDDISRYDKCFHTVLQKVQLARAETDPSKKNKNDSRTMLTIEIDEWKKRMEEQGRKIMTPIYYDTFLLAPEKTANTILITTAVDLQIFSNVNVDRLTRYNDRYPDFNIKLDTIGCVRTYVFLGIPQSHQAYNFLIAMLYSQLYGRLYDMGEKIMNEKYFWDIMSGIPAFLPFDTEEEAMQFKNEITKDNILELPYINNTSIYKLVWHGKEYKVSYTRQALEELIDKIPDMKLRTNKDTDDPALPIHVNFMLDEFKNIGEIPNFLTILSTSRKYRIGSHVVIQDVAQIKTMYPDDEHLTLKANVDTTIFLGSILTEDKKDVQELLGKTTIMQKSTSSAKSGVTTSYTPTEVDLLSLDEISAINQNGRNDCIVVVRDCIPVIEPKLVLFEHPNWDSIKNCKSTIDLKKYFTNNMENNLI